MIEVYRKPAPADSFDSEWHFHTQCPHWPETNFIQTRFLMPDERKRLCPECKALDAKMFGRHMQA